MGSRPLARARGWRSHASASAGSGPAINWRRRRNTGAKQKGAKTRPEGPLAHRAVDAGRNDHHGDTTAVLLLWTDRRASAGADQRGTRQAGPPWGDQYRERRSRVVDHRGLDTGVAGSVPEVDPSSLAWLEPEAFRGSCEPTQGGPGWGPGESEDRDPVAPQGEPRVESHGSPLETREASDFGRPSDARDRGVGAGGVSVPDRPEPS